MFGDNTYSIGERRFDRNGFDRQGFQNKTVHADTIGKRLG